MLLALLLTTEYTHKTYFYNSMNEYSCSYFSGFKINKVRFREILVFSALFEHYVGEPDLQYNKKYISTRKKCVSLHRSFEVDLHQCGFYLGNKFIYLFLAELGFHCCAQAFSSCGKWDYSSLRCTGFSLWWPLLLQAMGSRHAGFSSCRSQALECRLSSCGSQA